MVERSRKRSRSKSKSKSKSKSRTGLKVVLLRPTILRRTLSVLLS